MSSTGSRSDWVSGAAATATGTGILMFTLFPLAIPLVGLTIVTMLLVALPLIALAAVVAILIGTWFVIRAAGRAVQRLHRSRGGRRRLQAPARGRPGKSVHGARSPA
jgi:hypothetical protein